MKKIIMKVRHYNEKLLNCFSSLVFYSTNHIDKKVFRENYASWREEYLKAATGNISGFIVPAWKEMSDAMTHYFVNGFSHDFLSHAVIRNAMFFTKGGNMQRLQLSVLKRYFRSGLRKVLKENPLGHPSITSLKYLTSHNTIHHMSHMVNFNEQTKEDISKKNHVVEWGGGYGNFARLLKNMNQNLTYTIIDLPVFSFIQATYLSTVFGKDKVHLVTPSEKGLIRGKINIIPLNEELVKSIDFGSVDVFVSTWALSESTNHAQDLVQSLNFFNAHSLLIAHQERSETMKYAEDIEKRLTGYSITYHEKIPYLKTDYYLFANKA